MIRSRSFALVDTESKVSACTHMPIVRYEDARFSKRDDSVIQEAELTVFVSMLPGLRVDVADTSKRCATAGW